MLVSLRRLLWGLGVYIVSFYSVVYRNLIMHRSGVI